MMLLLAAVAFACPSLDAEVERATTALLGGEFAATREALDTAKSSFACAPATTAQMARYWLVEGALAQFQGDAEAAKAPYATARTVAPDVFDERLGPKVRTAWLEATPQGQGTLLLEPERPAFLNGAGVSEWPAPVPATTHLVQVLGPDGKVRYWKLVAIAPGEDALLETGLPTTPDPEPLADVKPPVEPKRKKSPALLIVGGAAAVGAGALAGAAIAQGPLMDEAPDLATLDQVYGRQKVLGGTSYGLMGVAALSVGLHFVLK